MKIEIISEEEVTDIQPELVPPLLAVTGMKPYLRKSKYVYDSNNEHDMKMIEMVISCGINPSKIHEGIILKKQNNHKKSDEDYLLIKSEVRDLWHLLHNSSNSSYPFEKKCVICGKVGYHARYICNEYGKYCNSIRSLIRKEVKRILKRIAMLERRFVCSFCKKEYSSPRKDTKFCSIKCRVANHRKLAIEK